MPRAPLRGAGGLFVGAKEVTGGEAVVRIDTNARAVALQFEEMARRLPFALGAAMTESAAIIKHGIEANFRSEGADFTPSGWQELAAKTIVNKGAKATGGNNILVDSGALERSVTNLQTGLHVDPFIESLRIRADDRTVHLHQEGTVKMPARPIIGVTAHDAELVIKLFEEAVARSVLIERGFTQ